MVAKGAFERGLDRAGQMSRELVGQIEAARQYCRMGSMGAAYEMAVRLEETSEKLTILARVLPAYTGSPAAVLDAKNVMALSIPVDIGFTREGWFCLRIPALLPKKEAGSAEYVRSFLYPAMAGFFRNQKPVRYQDCVLAYRHVYSRERPERQRRDHDNIEVNMVSDIVALYVMPDDNPGTCTHYYCSAAGEDDRTEVYVVPKNEFPQWLEGEKGIPEGGMELYGEQQD